MEIINDLGTLPSNVVNIQLGYINVVDTYRACNIFGHAKHDIKNTRFA